MIVKLTFCATSSKCCFTKLLQAGWYKAKKLQGSRKVIKCDSRGKNSTFNTLNRAICSRAIGVLSMRSLKDGSNTVSQRQLLYFCSSSHSPLTGCPHQECLSVFSLLQIGHDTIHYMGLRGKNIDNIDIVLTRPAVLDLFNVWNQSGCCALA